MARVNLFQRQDFEVPANLLRGLAAPEAMNDRIQRDTRIRNIVIAVPRLYVLFRHIESYSTIWVSPLHDARDYDLRILFYSRRYD